ncbi:MAG TPA: hypothetical protein VNZ52_10280 [Candidatus Thermoplasmatota archaeon]|nr:hypothetical protein [Candidatus Thermoplasmatota archaeon]
MDRRFLLQGLAVWFLLLLAAVTLGGLREALLAPRLGAVAGRAVGTLLLATVIFLVTFLFLAASRRPRTAGDLLLLGLGWAMLTVGFEFLAGHYLFGAPWERLLAEYDLAEGRLWVLVPLALLAAPPLVGAARARRERKNRLPGTPNP